MGRLRFQISVSLDGYMAGPAQSVEDPLGTGGEALHEWLFELEAFNDAHGREGGLANPSTKVMEAMFDGVGATVMGRNMFGGGPGPWPEEEWNGWWGQDPPFHMPVIVLTHYSREVLELEGGNAFHFVTGGIDEALERAREAAGSKDVLIGGGAETIDQCLAAGEVDDFTLSVVPVLLGDGARLFAGVEPDRLKLRQTSIVEAPSVTHISYEVLD